jgi:hypothetical protein
MRYRYTVTPSITADAARVRRGTRSSTEGTNYSSTSAGNMSTEGRKMSRRSGNVSMKTVYRDWPPLYSATTLPLSNMCAKPITPEVWMFPLEKAMFAYGRTRIVSRLNSSFLHLGEAHLSKASGFPNQNSMETGAPKPTAARKRARPGEINDAVKRPKLEQNMAGCSQGIVNTASIMLAPSPLEVSRSSCTAYRHSPYCTMSEKLIPNVRLFDFFILSKLKGM